MLVLINLKNNNFLTIIRYIFNDFIIKKREKTLFLVFPPKFIFKSNL